MNKGYSERESERLRERERERERESERDRERERERWRERERERDTERERERERETEYYFLCPILQALNYMASCVYFESWLLSLTGRALCMNYSGNTFEIKSLSIASIIVSKCGVGV